MRFGFFFFAEYVNVFILSALTVTLFLGGWNAPLDLTPVAALGAHHRSPSTSSGLGVGLLIAGRSVVPLILILLLALPFWMSHELRHAGRPLIDRLRPASTLLVVAAVLDLGVRQLRGSSACSGSSARPTSSSSSSCWMRGTLPRVRIDQLMGFAWKWLLPVVAAQPVRDRRRDPRGQQPRGRRDELACPAWASLKGMALTFATLLRSPRSRSSTPRSATTISPQSPRPPPAALRRVRHAQVRDVLPVRPGLPDRVHRHGRRRHARPLPRPLGPRRAVRRAARGVGPAPLRPAGPRPGLRAVRSRSTWRPLDAILADEDYDPRALLAILGRTQDAYGHLPVAALKHISHRPAPGTPRSTAPPPSTTSSHGPGRRPRAGHLPLPELHVPRRGPRARRRPRRRPRPRRRHQPRGRRAARGGGLPRQLAGAVDVTLDGAVQADPTAKGVADLLTRLRAGHAPADGPEMASPILRQPAGWPSVLLARAGKLDARAGLAEAEKLGAWAAWKSAVRQGPEAVVRRRQRRRPAGPRRGRLPDGRQVARRAGPARPRALRRGQRLRGRPRRRRRPHPDGGRPHAVLEGLALAAFAVGAEEAFLVVRADATRRHRATHGGPGGGPGGGDTSVTTCSAAA